jgi:hypothetical protein
MAGQYHSNGKPTVMTIHFNWISIVLFSILAIAALGKAVMDTLQQHFCCSVFKKYEGKKWIDPGISWMNKYKDGNSKKGPRFFGSTTFFVFVTDLWHFSDFIYLRFIFSVPIIYSFTQPMITWWADYLIYSIFFTVIFQVIYSLFQKR